MNIMIYFIQLIAAVTIFSVCGRVYHDKIKVNNKSNSLSNEQSENISQIEKIKSWNFGFIKGGTSDFFMQCPTQIRPGSDQFHVLFCDADDSRKLLSELGGLSSMCLPPGISETEDDDTMDRYQGAGLCHRRTLVRRNHTNVYHIKSTFDAPYTRFYSIYLLQCLYYGKLLINNTSDIKCQGTLTAMNPSGVHLSSDEVYIPLIYITLSCTWACLIAVWTLNSFLYYSYSNYLHKLISLAPLLKMMYVTIALVMWRNIASAGVNNSYVKTLYVMANSLNTATMFVLMMVVCEGWGVLYMKPKHFSWPGIASIYILFSCSLMCSTWIHNYFLVCAVSCAAFTSYKTYKCLARNRDLLTRRRRRMRRFVLKHQLQNTRKRSVDDQLVAKLSMYRSLRALAATFTVGYALSVTFFSFAVNHSYVQVLVMEGIQLYLYACLGYTLRLRNFCDYELVELAAPSADVAVVVMPSGGGGGPAGGGAMGVATAASPHGNIGRGVAIACPVNRDRPTTAATTTAAGAGGSASATIAVATIISEASGL